ncbi:MAG: hypothetical protein ACRCYP_01150 [Alphaproteobacteria bacterium]
MAGSAHGYKREVAWKSWKHDDGTSFEGWFIAGLELPTGTITYRIPESLWNACHCVELPQAPQWDGHTSNVVLERMGAYFGKELSKP